MPTSAEVLEVLKAELKFLEDGGYGRSPQSPWRAKFVFEDSPSCPNFGDAEKPHACTECLLIDFVPQEWRSHATPCRMIPLNDAGQTIEHFYGFGTQVELERAVGDWLRKKIREIEAEAD